MRRELLNIVVRHPRLYALHQIKLSKNLFYEATANSTAQEVAKAEKNNDGLSPTFQNFTDLPRPLFYFPSLRDTTSAVNSHFFSLLPGQGEGCVLFVDPSTRVTVYDADTQTPLGMRPTYLRKPANSIILSSTYKRIRRVHEGLHSFFVMSTEDGSSELFSYCMTKHLTPCHNYWNWNFQPELPSSSPPFAAVVVDGPDDGSTIWASSKEGTFAQEMWEWRQADTWTLPFHGAAEYVPKFRRWFGVEDPKSTHHCLCAFKLASLAMAKEAPAPLHAWDYLDGLPDGWYASDRHLVNLGMGKFCIATRCFHGPSPEEEDNVKEVKGFSDELTVLTGVEVVRAKDGLQMIKHKSRYYNAETMGIHCVL